MQPFLNTTFFESERILSIIKGLGDFYRFGLKSVFLLFSLIIINYLHFLVIIILQYS